MLPWLHNFLTGCTHSTKVEALSDFVALPVLSGAIQSSYPGPTYLAIWDRCVTIKCSGSSGPTVHVTGLLSFLIFINKLAETLSTFGIIVKLFADDDSY